MKQTILSLLSLIGGLTFFLCSFAAEEQTQSLFFMALAVVGLLLTIGFLSFEGSTVQTEKENVRNKISN
ncbi:MAG: hypothetical protein ACOVP7_09510 [Lacibacter sp.]